MAPARARIEEIAQAVEDELAPGRRESPLPCDQVAQPVQNWEKNGQSNPWRSMVASPSDLNAGAVARFAVEPLCGIMGLEKK